MIALAVIAGEASPFVHSVISNLEVITLDEIMKPSLLAEKSEEGQAWRRSRSHMAQCAAEQLARTGVEPRQAVEVFWIPGRIEVLGKHTDYAGGMSLVAALERGFAVVAACEKSSTGIEIVDAMSGEQVSLSIEDCSIQPDLKWGLYVRTVVSRVMSNFGELPRGAKIAFASNLPPAAGMSSSSALITALFLALKALYRIEDTASYKAHIQCRTDLADYLGCMESGQTYEGLAGEGVGTSGGSQDHTAILCSREGWLRLFSYRPTRFVDEVALPEGYCFCVGSSGVRAEKTQGAMEKYNRASSLVRQILASWENYSEERPATLNELVEDKAFSMSRMEEIFEKREDGKALYSRLFQYVRETQEIIPGAMASLKARDLHRFGNLVDQSQYLAEVHLQNQVSETCYLTRTAKSFGAVASSAFGAGFGGSVWALVEANRAEIFKHLWQEDYIETFPHRKEESIFFIDRTGPGAIKF